MNGFGHLLTEGLPFLSVVVLLATLAFFGGRCPVSLVQGRCETVVVGGNAAKACCRKTREAVLREAAGKDCCRPGEAVNCKAQFGKKGKAGWRAGARFVPGWLS